VRDTRYQWTLAIFWLILITFLLCLPGSAIPHENWLDRIWADKWVHIILFTILVILWARVMGKNSPSKKKRVTKLIMLGSLASAYGLGMEFIQLYFIENRSFDGWDVVADLMGVATGMLVSMRYIKK
jgi:VanZ family protein